MYTHTYMRTHSSSFTYSRFAARVLCRWKDGAAFNSAKDDRLRAVEVPVAEHSLDFNMCINIYYIIFYTWYILLCICSFIYIRKYMVMVWLRSFTVGVCVGGGISVPVAGRVMARRRRSPFIIFVRLRDGPLYIVSTIPTANFQQIVSGFTNACERDVSTDFNGHRKRIPRIASTCIRQTD